MRARFGQNFLVDPGMIQAVVDAVDPRPGETVLEIGPGKGALTRSLAERAGRLIAVELDRELAARLTARFSARPAVTIVQADFLRFDTAGIAGPVVIAGNLPYCSATAIITGFAPLPNWDRAVVMVQKEVAHRITALPGSREYGWLTLACGYYASARRLFDVRPGCFSPPPQIMSSVIRLENRRPAAPAPGLFPLISASFTHRRKTMLNALASLTGLPKTEISQTMRSLNIDPSVRPEALDLAAFECLTSRFNKHIIVSENANR